MIPGKGDYERTDISSRGVTWFAASLMAAVLAILTALWFFQRALQHSYPSRIAKTGGPALIAPPPRLQVKPGLDLAEMRDADEASLHSYGWMDRGAGIVRIPIERAIAITAERGIPARGASQPNAPQPAEQKGAAP